MSWRFWRYRNRDRDLEDEIQTHLRMAERDRVARGDSPRQARADARREFGNVAQVAEVARQMHPWEGFGRLAHEVRMGIRSVSRRPGTAAMAATLLAMAIGIATTMFTIADAYLFRPLPFHDADRIAQVSMRGERGGRFTVAPAVLRAWRQTSAFALAEGVTDGQALVETPLGPTVKGAAFVTPGIFDLLGVHPVRGRVFTPGEAREGRDDLILISDELSRSLFGSPTNAVGRQLKLNDRLSTVVGVMPARFRFPSRGTEIWQPIDYDAQPPGSPRLPAVYVRIAEGVPESDALLAATDAAHAADPTTAGLRALGQPPIYTYAGTAYTNTALQLIAGGVGLIFVALSAGAAALLLARVRARQREFSLCSALGASRARLLRQVTIESSIVGLGATAGGLLLAGILIAAARIVLPEAMVGRSLNILDVDARALVVTAIAGIGATLASGWVPAWIGTRRTQALSALGRHNVHGQHNRGLTRVFLAGEVALACTLLVAATLCVRSFVNLTRIDPGFAVNDIVAVGLTVTDQDALAGVLDRVVSELGRLPGVEGTAVADSAPESGGSLTWTEVRPNGPTSAAVPVQFQSYGVTAAWFGLHGIDLLRGRPFASDDEGTDRIIVSAELASKLWPASEPVGRRIVMFDREREVIGVAEDTRAPVGDLEPVMAFAEFYFPFSPTGRRASVSLRCPRRCPSEGVVTQTVQSSVPGVTVSVTYLDEVYRQELAQPRAMATLGLLFGGLALVIAAGGLFASLNHAVDRRRREFGIRLALGASPLLLGSLVARDGILIVAVGVALGLVGAWFSTRALEQVLVGVTSYDFMSWVVVLAAILGATTAGAWWPARQAMRTNPVALLRED